VAEWTTDEINKLLQDVHSGKTHLFNLPTVVYNRVATELTGAVFEAFNLDADTNLLNPDFETPRQLKRNCYVFSAAKTFQQIQDMQNFLFDERGFKRSFNEFNKAAEGIFNTYNRTWLEAEFETATRQAESAAEWERLQAEAEIFPLLRYKTLEDGSVREEHKTLNGVVRPANDSFWDRFTPPNGWRCRCFIEQLEEDEAPITEIQTQGGKVYRRNRRWLQEVEQPTKLFDFNPAKEGVIFRDDAQGKGLSHPYFKVDTRWDVHKRNNFGLPLPPDVKDLQPLKTVGTQKVKVATAKPTPLKTTPVETPKDPVFKPKNIKEITGQNITLSNEFWNLLKVETPLIKATELEGSYHNGGVGHGKVYIQPTKNKTINKLILAHEYGHAIHNQRTWHFGTNIGVRETNKKIEKVFNKWKKQFKKPEYYNKLNREELQKKFSKLFKEQEDLFWEYEESIQDVIGALTNGKYGFGHSKTYYKRARNGGAISEFLAHGFENRFVGNPLFKEVYPELYKELNELLNDLIANE
jgi:SPP1 gp7 family putative phage head morphogenesis protein